MADTNTTQASGKTSFNPFNPFNVQNPFDSSVFAGFTEMWQKAAGDQQARIASLFEELAKVEEKNAVETRRAIEEMSRLSLASLDYSRELSANFRRMAMEMTKRIAEPPAAAPAGADKAKKN